MMTHNFAVAAFCAAALLAGTCTARAGQYVFTDAACTTGCDQIVTGTNRHFVLPGTNDPLSFYVQAFTADATTGRIIAASVQRTAAEYLTNSRLAVNSKPSSAYRTSAATVNAAGVLAGEYFHSNDLGHAFTAVRSTAPARRNARQRA